MKTILIPIFHGHIARNILRTDVLKHLIKAPNVRVVLLVPDFKHDSYEKEFGGPQVVVRGIQKIVASKLDRLFRKFYYYFVDTDTVRIIQGQQFWITNHKVRYWYTRCMTKIFGNLRPLRHLVRFLDGILVKDHFFGALFDEYKPDLVFIPSLTSDDEILVLRQAKARGIKSVGMIRSWDNITVNKGNIRVYPDKLLVHGIILKDDVVRYADMAGEKIEVVGMSHFDYYWNESRIPREEFFARVGGDRSKKTVYFMPIGLSDQEQDKKMLKFMEETLSTDPRLVGTQLMLSAHPNTDKTIDYKSPDTVLIQFPGVISYPGGKLTDREITKGDMELMASGIFHSALVVNYQGTTSLDAAAFDKPVINIAFDEVENKPYLKSIKLYYDFDHYQPILKSGGVRIAHSKQELVDLMAEYLAHPERDKEGREFMVKEQNGGTMDGKASERTAHAILSLI